MDPVAVAQHQDGNLVGQEVEGRYLIRKPLGSGAMGLVFEAEARGEAVAAHGQKRVAIKVIHAHHMSDPVALARFTHEAFLGSKLRHRGLVRTLDFGHLPDGRPWFAMELFRGATLDKLLAVIRRLPPAQVAAFIGDAASALTVLHQHGLVHRDVKPANLMLTGTKTPRLRLLDLGIVGVFDARRAARIEVEEAGKDAPFGTPAYVAPEQALGGHVDPRADVYSLACVAYRMLTGRDALRARSVEATLKAHLLVTPKPASQVNPELPLGVDDVLGKALAKDRRQRYASVREFADALADALALN